MVNKLVNRVSAASIVITADHGFIYKRDAMEQSDKIAGIKFDDGEDNRRFILTTNNDKPNGTVSFSMDYLLGKVSGKNPEPAALWPRRKRSAATGLSRRARLLEAESGRIDF